MPRLLGYNDAVLMASLSFSSIDLLSEWDSFKGCSKPIHAWLVVSYAFVVALRAAHLYGAHLTKAQAQHADGSSTASEEFIIDLRHQGAVARLLVSVTWKFALPFFIFWTFLGTRWMSDVMQHSPTCVPSQEQLYFAMFWLVLCYGWIVVHCGVGGIAWVLELRVRHAERDLRAVEDDDVLARWGQVSQISDFHALDGRAEMKGLTPGEIQALPSERYEQRSCCEEECSICICQLEVGEAVRRLPSCGHTFHKSCIDLWLLRRADCPLCKRDAASSRPGGVDAIFV